MHTRAPKSPTPPPHYSHITHSGGTRCSHTHPARGNHTRVVVGFFYPVCESRVHDARRAPEKPKNSRCTPAVANEWTDIQYGVPSLRCVRRVWVAVRLCCPAVCCDCLSSPPPHRLTPFYPSLSTLVTFALVAAGRRSFLARFTFIHAIRLSGWIKCTLI